MKYRALSVLGLCAVTTGALAQPRGPMGGRPFGGSSMGRSMMRSAKGRVPRLVEGAARLGGADALSKKQARRMVALVSPWKSRPRMSEAQAQTFLAQASGVLTPTQKATLEAERPGFGGPRNGRGGPDGGSGGPRPGGRGFGGGGPRGGGGFGGGGMQQQSGAQQNAMRAMMASFNPFYAGSNPQMAELPERMQQGMQQRRDRLNAALSQLQQRAR